MVVAGAGMVVWKHRLENRSGEHLHLVEVQVGDYLGEDDIRRFEDMYGRVLDTPGRESTPSTPIFPPGREHMDNYGCQKISYHGGFIGFVQSQHHNRVLWLIKKPPLQQAFFGLY